MFVLVSVTVLIATSRPSDAHCWRDVESPGVNFATAKEACEDYIKKKYPNDTGWIAVVAQVDGDPFTFRCTEYFDEDEWWDIGVVTAHPAQDHCYTLMNGPYANTNVGGSAVGAGLPYTTNQRNAIRSANEHKCYGNLGSDFASTEANKILAKWLGVVEKCSSLRVGATITDPECAAQIHHLIPRKDENGCGCGENSAGNAVVVSAWINQKMSNRPPPQALIDYVNNMSASRCMHLLH